MLREENGCGHIGTLSNVFAIFLKINRKKLLKKKSLLKKGSLGTERVEGPLGIRGWEACWRRWHLSRDRQEDGRSGAHREQPGTSWAREPGGGPRAMAGEGSAEPALDPHPLGGRGALKPQGQRWVTGTVITGTE